MIPARASRSVASGTSARDDRGVRVGQAEPGAEAVRELEIVLVDGLDADLVEELQERGSVPTHENHAGDVSKRRAVRASRSGGPNWSFSGSVAANQPGLVRREAVDERLVEDHERGAARAHQPLVGGAGERRRSGSRPPAASRSRAWRR